ncbi:pyridoxamine 5'-phosphate oxidase family protein [Acetobacterium wieringae]|uniref:pyridoxamine 5'-phosphate oxidase family protein n=1 Tax=Acetobacterium wieringae TaxID=52694 RepID=UPI002B1E95AC|nr:pyridoxamine 5'-phosphate oxidase family protein [Acetobacterium wieringae]MEA4804950.1 pyridoxamine 5'-phosphate oxidase family protein [Acetobacterium wieringae]
MRRKNREVTELTEIIEIINGCKVCRLAMVDNDVPYVVPLNFGYHQNDSVITIFLHCAREGRKIEILKQNNQVCIEMDQMKELLSGEKGCDYSCYFESFIGTGQAVFLDDAAAKAEALQTIMKQQTGRDDFCFDQHVLEQTSVIAVELRRYSGKRH